MAQRSRANVELGIGLLFRTTGKLYPIKNTESERETKMFMVCPQCKGAKVEQFYVGTCGHTPEGVAGYRQGDIPDRGRMEADKLVVMTEAEIEDARGSKLAKGLLELLPRPADEVEAQTFPAGTSYWLEPDRADKAFTLFREIVQRSDIALVGTMNLAGSEKFFRVTARWGGVVLEELLRPRDVNHFDPPAEVEPTERERKIGTQIVETLVEAFDPDEFNADATARLQGLIAAKAGGASPVPATAGGAPQAVDDLERLLEASLEAARATKAS